MKRKVLIAVVSLGVFFISFQAWQVGAMYWKFFNDAFLVAHIWPLERILHTMAGYVLPAWLYFFLGTTHHRWVFLSAVLSFGLPMTGLIPKFPFGLPAYVGLNLVAILVLLSLSLRRAGEIPRGVEGSFDRN